MSSSMEKKNLYFNFGPEESYFLRCGAQHRSYGDIAGRKEKWIDGNWVKFDCVAWKHAFYFASRHNNNRINQNKVSDNAPEKLRDWVNERQFAPLRFILSDKEGNWFAWMLHGDFLPGHNAPQGMIQAALDSRKSYTSIRCAAVGVENTWLLIWEDGDMRYSIEEKYPRLHKKLKGLRGDDVSWVALNPFREGDYFLYVEETKTASFQVSEAFGVELKEALNADGIDTTDLVFREQQIVIPMKFPDHITDDIVGVTTENVKINSDQFINAALKVIKTSITVIKVGATIAGAVTCTVM